MTLFDWATRLADLLLTPQGLECLKEWGEAYQFPLAPRKPPGFTADDNLEGDVVWKVLISQCMARKPPEIAAGECCGAVEGSTQTPEVGPASQNDVTEDDDDDVLIVTY